MSLKHYIKLKNLRKVYPRKLGDQLNSVLLSALGRSQDVNSGGGVALSNLTLSIKEGERIGIIGPNGAGKSTLLQILAGVTEPTSGYLKISGRVTAVLTLGVGLKEELTGRENIYIDGEAQGKTRAEINQDITNIVNFAELGKFIDLPLKTYSTGMKARLAFAMITQINPEILIIDETLSVGDAAFTLKAGQKIAELCSRGAIVLIVSHSMQSIRDLCNRCIWLDQANLVMDGDPELVTQSYLDSVRKADDIDQITRFRNLLGTKSILSGYDLSELKISCNGQDVRQVPSGKILQIRFNWSINQKKSSGQFHLKCIRLDGALIFDKAIQLPIPKSSNNLLITFPEFNLASGVYRFHLKWINSKGTLCAESSAMLEVLADNIPSGGRPILLNVGSIDCLKLNKTTL